MSTKEYKCFKVDVEDHVANLVLSRPNELNTMSRDFWVELGDVLEEINKNSDIRVVVMSSQVSIFVLEWILMLFLMA